MTENTENLVLELLRQVRADITALRADHGERLNRIDIRLGAVEHTLGSLYSLSASDRDALTALTRRVERIERRLELHDETP